MGLKFSVVMPCYNTQDFLPDAMDSIIAQDYKNFEVILVDDCSPDGVGALCDEYEAQYGFVKAIHNEKNLGLSASRNRGFASVSSDSDFVFFMDSDDKVEPNLFSLVAESLNANPAKVVSFGLVEDYYDNEDNFIESFPITFPKSKILNTRDLVRKEIIHIEESTLYGYVWNKFYSVPYLKSLGVEFETITLIEDIKFNVSVFQDIDSVNLLENTPYHYKKRSDAAGSLTSKFLPNYFELSRTRVELVYNQLNSWGVLGAEEKRILGNILVRYIFSALQRNCDKRAGKNLLTRKLWLSKLYRDPLFLDLITYAKTDNKVLAVMIWILKHKLSIVCLALGRFIYFVKTKSPAIFSKAKQNR